MSFKGKHLRIDSFTGPTAHVLIIFIPRVSRKRPVSQSGQMMMISVATMGG